jgi:thimet oligopeptidase
MTFFYHLKNNVNIQYMLKNKLSLDASFLSWKPADIRKMSRNAVKNTEKSIEKFIVKYSQNTGNFDAVSVMTELETIDPTRLVGTPLYNGDNLIDLFILVSTDKRIRDAARQASDFISINKTSLFMKEGLYTIIKNLNTNNIDPVTQNLVNQWLHYFQQNGIHLPVGQKRSLLKIEAKLQKLQSDFQKNIADYTEKVTVPVEHLTGLTPDQCALFTTNNNMVSIGTSYPEYNTIMPYAENDTLRAKVLRNFMRRGTIKNIRILSQIVKLRKQLAQVLDKKEYLQLTTEHNMIGTPQKLKSILQPLQKSITAQAHKEQKTIARYIGLQGDTLSLSNNAYWQRNYIKDTYDIDSGLVKEYFPLDHVITSCFKIFEQYFSLTFTPEKTTLWETSVTLYSVRDKKSKNLFGYIALDLHPRPGKYTHACMCQPISAEIIDGKQTHPLVVMVANFPVGTGKNSSLLSLYEVETLLHEFGHILHGVLSRTAYSSQSGTHTKMDYVEIPSQFMERFLYQKDILKMFSKHFKTGKPFPPVLLNKLLHSEHRALALHTLRQFTNIELDSYIHKDPSKDSLTHWKEIRKKYNLLPEPSDFLMPASFGHLASAYGNSYWVYMLSNIFAQDAWDNVMINGKVSKSKTLDFRKNILESGSMISEYKLLKKFLGRNPNGNAFKKYIQKSFL